MTISITRQTNNFATAPQISPADMQEIAEHGFKTVINNRPDGEGGPTQPTSSEMEKAAQEAGLRYAYLPVVSGQIIRRNDEATAALPGQLIRGSRLAPC